MFERIYLDSSALIELSEAKSESSSRCAEIVDKATVVIASQLLILECVAPAIAEKKTHRRRRILGVLNAVTTWVDVNAETLDLAVKLASRTAGLRAADAIHLAICQEHDAVFLNAERPGNAPNQVSGVETHTIYQ